MMHLEGRALQWHQRFMRNHGSLREVSWSHYLQEILIQFNNNDYINPMLELVGLKQNGSVDEYYDEFES